MGNAPSSSSRSTSHTTTAPTSAGSSSSAGQPGHSTSAFASLTSRARARSKSNNVPLSAAQILASEPLTDGGHSLPLGLYQLAPWDFSRDVVRKLIHERKMAPFYLGLEDWDDDWDEAAVVRGLREARFTVDKKRQVLREAGEPTGEVDPTPSASPSASSSAQAAAKAAASQPARLKEGPPTEVERREAEWFSSATAECPLCFLYFPANINTSRCCDQPICTECFVQIKRAEATATHLESEPACCPFCMEPNFGILYNRPRPKLTSPNSLAPASSSAIATAISSATSAGGALGSPAFDDGSGFDLPEAEAAEKRAEKKRRQSVSHTEKDVVTVDQIRPDWQAKLDAVKATVARRANRRIVMRQVGDRLIPIGITSSRDPIAPINIGNLGEAEGTDGRTRRRSRQQGGSGEVERLLSNMGLGGADIEELMLMEAMRLSLVEHEQQQAREAAAANNPSGTAPDAAAAAAAAAGTSTTSDAAAAPADTPTTTTTSAPAPATS